MNTAYENILVALDGSEESEWAFKKAIDIAKRNDATLHLVHIVEYYHYTRDTTGTLRREQEEFGEGLLENHKSKAQEEGVQKINSILEFGSAKVKISKSIAKDVKADLIICGATGLNAVERFIIGSVSENIVRSSHCDVLVVRTPEA